MDAQTNVTSTGQKIRTVDITVTAAMAALVFLGTYIFKIPTISGYVHLGDCMILLTVALFGMKKVPLQVPSAADYLILLADISTGLFQHC